MNELHGKVIYLRYDGRGYEGTHDGIEYEGPFPFHRIKGARAINWQDCSGDRPTAGDDWYAIPGVMLVPVGACLIHPTHLTDRV